MLDLVNKYFTVTKIESVLSGEDKSTWYPHAKAFRKVVRLYNTPIEGGSVVMLIQYGEEKEKGLHTSRVESVEVKTNSDGLKTVIIETLNTIYTLEEIKTRKEGE